MPVNTPHHNPFAPPEAPIGPPEPDPPSASSDLTEPYDGPDVNALFRRWELARLAYNGVAGLVAYGILGWDVLPRPRNPTIVLLGDAILLNLAFSVGPILAYARVPGDWASPRAAALLCLVGVVLTLVTVGLLAWFDR